MSSGGAECVDVNANVNAGWRGIATRDEVQELAMMMFLPNLLSVVSLFAATGNLNNAAGILQMGVLVLNGPATVSIVLNRLDSSRSESLSIILALAVLLIPTTALAAGYAPTLSLVVPAGVSAAVGAAIIATLAVSLGTNWYDDVGPSVKAVGALLAGGLLAYGAYRVLSGAVSLDVVFDWGLFWRGALAGAIAIGVVAFLLLGQDYIRRRIDLQRLRFGFACALSLLSLELIDVIGDIPSVYVTGFAILLATERAG